MAYVLRSEGHQQVGVGLIVVFEDGISRYYSDASKSTVGAATNQKQQWKHRILSWSRLQRSGLSRDYQLPKLTFSVEIDDADYDITKILSQISPPEAFGGFGSQGKVVLIYNDWPGPEVGAHQLLGSLVGWRRTRSGTAWELTFGPLSKNVIRPFNRPAISKNDFPNCPPEVEGQAGPLVYGAWARPTGLVGGMLPAFLVDNVSAAQRWVAAFARVKSITTVYDQDGNVLNAGAWDPAFPVVNGHQWSTIDMVPDDDLVVVSNGTFTAGNATIAAQPLSPSPVTVTVTDGDSSITEFVLTFTGEDSQGKKLEVEYKLSEDGKVWESKERFSKVVTVARSGLTGSAAGDTWKAGVSYRQESITWDGDGYEATGDGSGSLITDPLVQIRHFARHAAADYQQGPWLAYDGGPQDPVDPGSAQFYLAEHLGTNYQGRLYVDDGRTVEDLINQAGTEWGVQPTWNRAQLNVVFKAPDHRPYQVSNAPSYGAGVLPVLREGVDFLGDTFEWQTLTDGLAAGIEAKYVYCPAQGKHLNRIRSEDSSRTGDVLQAQHQWTYLGPNRGTYLLRFGRPWGFLKMRAPLWILEADNASPYSFLIDLYSLVLVEHQLGPTANGAGWGSADYQRRLMRVVDVSIDPGTLSAELLLEDMRYRQWTLYGSLQSKLSTVPSPYFDGVIGVGVGTFLTPTRGSYVWTDSPDGRQVVKLDNSTNVLHLDRRGTFSFPASTNYVTRSSFVDGTTGWSATGAPASTIAVDTTLPRLFEDKTTPQGLKFTANAGSAGGAAHTTASAPSGTDFNFSFDYRSEASAGLTWAVFRNNDSQYWNDSTGAWQGTDPGNTLPDSVGVITRFVSKRILAHGAASTYFVGVGAAASKVGYLYHAQFESLPYASSRIVTSGGSTATRNADNAGWTNDANGGYENWPHQRGTFFVTVVPQFTSGDLPNGLEFVVQEILYDASNSFRLSYLTDAGGDKWRFRVRRGGSNFDAEYVVATTRNTEVDLACRWTSASGEEGLTAFTASLFVDKVRRADVVFSSQVAYAAGKTLRFGHSDAIGNHAAMAIKHWHLTATVFSDFEVAMLTP